MPLPYPDFSQRESRQSFEDDAFQNFDPLHRVAAELLNNRPRSSRLSPLIFMTDPARVPDPVRSAQRLPEGSAVIYRHFGDPNRVNIAHKLRKVTASRGQQLLIGDDPALMETVGADGVHFKRDPYLVAAQCLRDRAPDALISMAGLKGETAKYFGDLSCLEGILLSSVFASDSPTAGMPLGIVKFAQLCTTLPVPVFALGGINAQTVSKLKSSGAAGFAAIGGLECGPLKASKAV